ncbi:hypothetical protein ACAF76_001570 [Brevibacillus sp. TJ4]|uniref:hypothetical protein n=1 Tax=Brevibacillus sp. TJ4 TaxID=3234853 RepID=UPI0037CDC8E3
MNKKLVLSVLSTAVVASMASSAFAAPKDGVYLGGSHLKLYSVDTLLNMNSETKEAYKTAFATSDFKQVVFVNLDGTGATIDEILTKGFKEATSEPLKKSDFADSYTVVNPDGTEAGTYNPQDEIEEEAGELVVEGVTSISKAGVTVAITKLAADLEGATIEVKDNNGNVVEVKPLNLVVNETVATFEFKTALTADPTGVWTVAGISFDADAYAKLEKINAANAELALYNALTEAGIANLKVENAPAYIAEKLDKTEAFKSLEEVQAFVDKVNADQASDAEKAAQVEALVKALETTSQVAILNALAPWAQVNPEYISDYASDLAAVTVTDTFDDVQDIINTTNITNAGTLLNDAFTESKREAYNKAVTAVSFVRADDPEDPDDKVKADMQEALEVLNLLLNVKEASTAAQFANAYNALVAKVNDKTIIGDEVFYTDLRPQYMEATKAQPAGVPETVTTPEDIEDAIVAVNTKKRAELYNAVAEVSDTAGSETKTADVLKKLQDFAAYVPNKADFDISTVSTTDDRLKAYRTALAALPSLTIDSSLTEGDVATAIADVKNAIDTVNGTAVGTPLGNIENFDSSDATTFPNGVTDPAQALLTYLKHKELALGNVVDANAELYLANEADFKAAATVGAGTAADAIKAVKALVADLNQVAIINKAKSATEVHDALMALALPDYLNVTSADRLTVAESLLEVVQDDAFVEYESKADVAADVATITADRAAAIAAVNALLPDTDITDVIDALDLVGYKAFSDMSAADKALVAEKFAEALEFNADGTALKSPYRSLAAIKAHIDAAIAAQ